MVGQGPNSAGVEHINRGYWQNAYVDDYSLWVQSGAVQTSLYPTGNAPFGTPAYHSLSVPRTDVFRTWPRASIARKLATFVFLGVKFLWYAVRGRIEHLWHRVRNWRRR
jgi:hypothetical protein